MIENVIENLASAGFTGVIIAILLYYIIKSREEIDKKLLTMVDGKLDELLKLQNETISVLKEISINQETLINEMRTRTRRQRVRDSI